MNYCPVRPGCKAHGIFQWFGNCQNCHYSQCHSDQCHPNREVHSLQPKLTGLPYIRVSYCTTDISRGFFKTECDPRIESARGGKMQSPRPMTAQKTQGHAGRIGQERASPTYVPSYSSTIMVPSITQLLFKKLALSLDWGPNLSV